MHVLKLLANVNVLGTGYSLQLRLVVGVQSVSLLEQLRLQLHTTTILVNHVANLSGAGLLLFTTLYYLHLHQLLFLSLSFLKLVYNFLVVFNLLTSQVFRPKLQLPVDFLGLLLHLLLHFLRFELRSLVL
jgi:hypothetical protein